MVGGGVLTKFSEMLWPKASPLDLSFVSVPGARAKLFNYIFEECENHHLKIWDKFFHIIYILLQMLIFKSFVDGIKNQIG